MEIEREMHQREKKALCAQVIEAEEWKDAAVQEALKKVEAMKKECDGIPSYFIPCSLFSLFLAPFLPNFLLLSCLALRKDKQTLLTDIEDMKISVQSSHNRAEEVKARAKEELARAQLIRLGAD
jgi:hypothetical protein